MAKPKPALPVPSKSAKELTSLEISAIVKRASQGDKAALEVVRAVLDVRPDEFGPPEAMARVIEDRYLKVLTGPADELSREVYRRNMERLRRELAGESPTPLERLLADRVVACWLQVQHADKCMAGIEEKSHPLTQGAYARHRQDRAHKRYLSAIKTLAQVRRLQLPAVQINVGAQQVNTINAQASIEAAG